MKVLFFILVVLNLLVNINIFSYDDDDHMYLTYEAYFLLKNQGHCFPEMEYHLGNLQDQGTHSWQMSKITTGAYREDIEDPVFLYSAPPGWPPNLEEPWVTCSHFWDADQQNEDDDTHLYWSGLYGHNDYWENSYKKIKYYRDGDWRNEDGIPTYINIIDGQRVYKYMYYEGLIQLYITGRVWCEGFTTLNGGQYPVHEWRYLDWEDRNKIVWEILGRMCHLLQDQTVPAHAHGDVHAPIFGNSDCYESWVTQHKNEYNRYNVGQFIDPFTESDPVRYLTYTGNQLADYWPSSNNCYGTPSWVGDRYLRHGSYPLLDAYYAQLPNPSPSTLIFPDQIAPYNLKYAIRSTAGLLYWFAVSVGLPQFTSPPVLQSFNFNLSQQRVYARETGILTANILNANSYGWQYYKCGSSANGCGNYSPLPNGLQIYGSGNKAYIKVFDDYVNQQCNQYPPTNCGNQGLLRFTFKVTAIASPCWFNDFLYQTELMPIAGIRPPPGGGGGCPYLYVWDSDTTYHVTDNNLLHRSEFPDFANQDITDKYKLLIHPNLNEGKFSIQIAEYENDHDYIDMIKLYAVDHPIGTKIAITEFNDIIMYDTAIVQGTDDANRNGINITSNIQYYYQGKLVVSGNEGDNIYAHYDSTAQSNSVIKFKKKYSGILNSIIPDSMALIGELDREPIGHKGWGGVATIFIDPNNSVDKKFAMRENMSEVIVPFSGLNDAVDHVEINWTNPFAVTYFAVVPVAYSGFDVTELTMFDALHSIDNSDILSTLQTKDNNYTELDSADFITIRFDSLAPPQNGWVRDFVIETNGRYTVGSGYANLLNMKSNIQNNSVYNFALHTNYPNPFNPKTLIKYDIGRNTFVKISVYNLLGQLIDVLVNENREPGNYSVEFDGTNLPSGLYIYKIEAGDYIESKKMLLVK